MLFRSDIATYVYHEGTYVDAHCTVWTSSHFAELIKRAIDVGLLNVEIGRVARQNVEFVAVLKKLGNPKRQPPEAPASTVRMEAEIAHMREHIEHVTRAYNDVVAEKTRAEQILNSFAACSRWHFWKLVRALSGRSSV